MEDNIYEFAISTTYDPALLEKKVDELPLIKADSFDRNLLLDEIDKALSAGRDRINLAVASQTAEEGIKAIP